VTVGTGSIVEGADIIEGLKKIGTYYNEMSLMAWNEYGITLSVEAPHRNTISEKYEQIVNYWAHMPERLRCTFDVAHITFANAGIERVMNFVGSRIAHVHLRDADIGNSRIPYGREKDENGF
jgi:sugar phosphate isomerase/epimerase